jgi:hypothetical protein
MSLLTIKYTSHPASIAPCRNSNISNGVNFKIIQLPIKKYGPSGWTPKRIWRGERCHRLAMSCCTFSLFPTSSHPHSSPPSSSSFASSHSSYALLISLHFVLFPPLRPSPLASPWQPSSPSPSFPLPSSYKLTNTTPSYPVLRRHAYRPLTRHVRERRLPPPPLRSML